jgi:hypothetical protein
MLGSTLNYILTIVHIQRAFYQLHAAAEKSTMVASVFLNIVRFLKNDYK